MEGREALEKLRKLESEGRLDEAIDVSIMTVEDVEDCFDDYADKFYPTLNKDDKELLYKHMLKDKDWLFGIISSAWYETDFRWKVLMCAALSIDDFKEELAAEK